MKNTKLDLMERYLIILDKFVSKISESGVPQQKVIEQSYLFCSGFYIKYKQEIEKIKFSNSDVVLTCQQRFLTLPVFTADQYSLSFTGAYACCGFVE